MDNRFKLARTKYNRNGKQSVKTVSENTNITRSLIDDLESNVSKKRSVGYLTVAKLARYYGVTSDFLLGLVDFPTIDVDGQAACKYTGLSAEAVEMLHYFSRGSDPGVISNIPKHDKLNIAFINRVLSSVYNSSLKIDGEKIFPADTIFSFMEQYVISGSVNRLLSPEEERLSKSESESLEGLSKYEERLRRAGRYITIEGTDGDSLAMLTVGELYREHLFHEIRDHLDFYEKAEQSGNKWNDNDSKKK